MNLRAHAKFLVALILAISILLVSTTASFMSDADTDNHLSVYFKAGEKFTPEKYVEFTGDSDFSSLINIDQLVGEDYESNNITVSKIDKYDVGSALQYLIGNDEITKKTVDYKYYKIDFSTIATIGSEDAFLFYGLIGGEDSIFSGYINQKTMAEGDVFEISGTLISYVEKQETQYYERVDSEKWFGISSESNKKIVTEYCIDVIFKPGGDETQAKVFHMDTSSVEMVQDFVNKVVDKPISKIIEGDGYTHLHSASAYYLVNYTSVKIGNKEVTPVRSTPANREHSEIREITSEDLIETVIQPDVKDSFSYSALFPKMNLSSALLEQELKNLGTCFDTYSEMELDMIETFKQYYDITKTYTLVLELNGGKLPEGENNRIDFKSGESLRSPSDPTREGYTFLGWSMDKDGEILLKKFHLSFNKDVTVYAQWAPIDDDVDVNTGNNNIMTIVIAGIAIVLVVAIAFYVIRSRK